MVPKNRFISGTIALIIMGVLILSGATTAVVININPDNTVKEGETADIGVGVDLKESLKVNELFEKIYTIDLIRNMLKIEVGITVAIPKGN